MLEGEHIQVDINGKTVVRDVSFVVPRGEIRVLMGVNGSGKSTLVNALFGHPRYTVTGGALRMDGIDIIELATEEKARRGLFFSPQHVPELDGVSFVNFMYRAYAARDKNAPPVPVFFKHLKETARAIGVPESFVSREVNVGLSGGEKKMSEILQMAILKPHYAFLDEIDSGVDVDTVRIIYRAIRSLVEQEKTGVLIITHNTDVLDHITPQKVYLMREGAIVRSGGSELINQVKKHGFTGVDESF